MRNLSHTIIVILKVKYNLRVLQIIYLKELV